MAGGVGELKSNIDFDGVDEVGCDCWKVENGDDCRGGGEDKAANGSEEVWDLAWGVMDRVAGVCDPDDVWEALTVAKGS